MGDEANAMNDWEMSAEGAERFGSETRQPKKPVEYAYIRRTYGVDPKIGQRITMDDRPGVIVRPQGDPQYLRVRFDGQKRTSNVHPTWRIDYAPA